MVNFACTLAPTAVLPGNHVLLQHHRKFQRGRMGSLTLGLGERRGASQRDRYERPTSRSRLLAAWRNDFREYPFREHLPIVLGKNDRWFCGLSSFVGVAGAPDMPPTSPLPPSISRLFSSQTSVTTIQTAHPTYRQCR